MSWTGGPCGCDGTHTSCAGKRADYYAEEVEHLTRFGSSPAAILAALNTTPSALARALQRQGRHDLAAPFQALYRRQHRPHRCADCAAPVSESRSVRCAPCAKAARRAGLIGPNTKKEAA